MKNVFYKKLSKCIRKYLCWSPSLRKIPTFHLMSWSCNFVERCSFSRCARNSTETVSFHKISTPRSYVKCWYFTQCILNKVLFKKDIIFCEKKKIISSETNIRLNPNSVPVKRQLGKQECSSFWESNANKNKTISQVTLNHKCCAVNCLSCLIWFTF